MMKAVNLNVNEEQKTMLVLCSFPERYMVFTNSLIYNRSTLTWENVKTRLLSKEVRDQMKYTRESGGASNSQRLVERGRKEKENSFIWRSKTRKSESGWRGKFRNNMCHHCKKHGHWCRDCPDLRKKNRADGSSSITAEKIVSDKVLIVSVFGILDHWVLYSGMSFHMTSRNEYFCSYESK